MIFPKNVYHVDANQLLAAIWNMTQTKDATPQTKISVFLRQVVHYILENGGDAGGLPIHKFPIRSIHCSTFPLQPASGQQHPVCGAVELFLIQMPGPNQDQSFPSIDKILAATIDTALGKVTKSLSLVSCSHFSGQYDLFIPEPAAELQTEAMVRSFRVDQLAQEFQGRIRDALAGVQRNGHGLSLHLYQATLIEVMQKGETMLLPRAHLMPPRVLLVKGLYFLLYSQ